jgi:filamentous hemagglutinin family protein
MKQVASRICLASSIALGCLVTLSPATAQIAPDNTLPVNSRVTPGCTACTIDGGTVRGANLFHSFSEFSVPTGGEGFFNNGLQIQNIFTRVTGNSVSSIDGRLRANGTANLFFLNPNGIIFGAGARLNIGGSFLVSTASGLEFADGTIFSATPATPITRLLTISVPIGLQYGSNAGSVNVRGSRLQVNPGQTLALVGGNVSINGGRLLALGGRVDLGGVAGQGSIELVANGSTLLLNFPVSVLRTDVSIINDALLNVRLGGGGSIAINARNVNITGVNTRLRAGIASGLGAVGSKAGDIEINATEAINIDASVISDEVQQGGVGDGGNINITTGSLSLTNGAQLNASTFGEGKAGNVNIVARDTVSFDGVGSEGLPSAVLSNVEETGMGDGGDVNITTGLLFVTGGAALLANTLGEGKAGNVNIVARDTVSFDGVGSEGFPSAALSNVEETGMGDGGDINITTGSLFATGGAQLNTNTLGEGKAGNVNIIARDTVSFDGVGSNENFSGATSSVLETGMGDGGDINIMTGSLLVTQGAQLTAATFGEGKAGNVNIVARDTVSLDGVGSDGFPSAAFSSVEETGIGDAGNVSITTGSLFVTGGAALFANTLGKGKAGNVNIVARDTVSLDGVGSDGFPSAAFSSVEETGIGDGGDINITTGSLFVTGGAQLTGYTFGEGKAGNVNIVARDTVSLDGVGSNEFSSGAFSSVEKTGIGDGGDINITTGSLFVTGGAQLTAATFGEGKAGNVNIVARDTVSLDGVGSDGFPSAAFSSVEETGIGDGGDVSIMTGSLFVTRGAALLANTFGEGKAGDVNIIARDTVSFDGVGSNGFSSAAFSAVRPTGMGDGGDINITTRSLSVTKGAQLLAFTSGEGKAGNVNIIARDTVSFDGVGSNGFPSAAFSSVEETGIGDGGNINIRTSSLAVTNSAQLKASSSGNGTAGSLNITANSVLLDNGQLKAEIPSGFTSDQEGANINLNVEEVLFLRDNSLISAKASGDAKGGNIAIDAGVLVALPLDGSDGSDIIASAERGSGGRIEIEAQGIFRLEERRAIPGNRTNDIDASSQFGAAGEVEVIAFVDPSRGLSQLPKETVDPTGQIAQECATRGKGGKDEFIVTGRGGLPQSPTELLAPDMVQDDLGTLVTEAQTRTDATPSPPPTSPPTQLVEAQGWIFGPDGKVILTASAANATPNQTWLPLANCQVSQTNSK